MYSERIDGQNRHCFFGCWLIVFIWTAVVDLSWGRKRLADTFEAVVLLRGSSPNSRHIDCIFSFLYKGLSFLAGEYAKIKSSRGEKTMEKPNKRKADLERTRQIILSVASELFMTKGFKIPPLVKLL